MPPLRTIRRDLDTTTSWRDPLRLGAVALLAAIAIGLSLWQAPTTAMGFGFAAGIAATTAGLWAAALGLMRVTRRHFPRRARYAVRQGVANLFRPRNQTLAVTLALGFGVFLISLLYVVQHTLLDRFRVDAADDRPNLVMFDIQRDQKDGVRAVLEAAGLPILQETPIVPARIHALNDRTVDEILATPGAFRYGRWALRREYRHTYRDTLVRSEELIAGSWWDPDPARDRPTVGRRSLRGS